MPVRGRVDIDERFCKGCELCVEVCPQEVLALDTESLTSKGYHPVKLTAEIGCTGCAVCAIVCPEAAITVYRELARAAAVPG
ncbi:MAG: 4Fe-4S dicluster domain-containing protein [Anaerolineales bacterium]|jgi:2-oxoglutarate ferredoxin oxidoreductase subunit delta